MWINFGSCLSHTCPVFRKVCCSWVSVSFQLQPSSLQSPDPMGRPPFVLSRICLPAGRPLHDLASEQPVLGTATGAFVCLFVLGLIKLNKTKLHVCVCLCVSVCTRECVPTEDRGGTGNGSVLLYPQKVFLDVRSCCHLLKSFWWLLPALPLSHTPAG